MLNPSILIVENDHDTPSGVIGLQLSQLAAKVRTVNIIQREESVADSELADYDGLVVLGGPMGAFDDDRYPKLVEVVRLIKHFHFSAKPILAVCLGAQLLARSLGSGIRPNKGGEWGFTPLKITREGRNDEVLSGMPESIILYQFHQDSIRLPADACLLMTSEECANQAFRVGALSWGFQFHPEIDTGIVAKWAELHAQDHPNDLDRLTCLKSGMQEHLPASMDFAKTITSRWLSTVRRQSMKDQRA